MVLPGFLVREKNTICSNVEIVKISAQQFGYRKKMNENGVAIRLIIDYIKKKKYLKL